MNCWFALVCALSFLGRAHSYYTSIQVGANSLVTMSNNLKTISTVVANHYTTLNTARTKVFAALNDLLKYANVTYTAMNNTYGSSQQMLDSLLYSVSYMNSTVASADNQVTYYIGYDLNSLSDSLRQSMDTIFQSFMMLSSTAYSPNGENCTLRNATQMANVANSLQKLGQCLAVEVNQVTAIVPNLLNIISYAKIDLSLLNNQLSICNAQSTSCINEYFNQVWSEWNYFTMSLYLLQSTLWNTQQEVYERNGFCGQLVRSDIQDDIQDLSMAVSMCMYPW